MSRAVLALCAAIVLAGLPALAQEPAAATASADSTRADETFDLDIAEKRITEPGYEASTLVEIRPGEGEVVEVKVGAHVRTGQIDLTLRGVRGRVRFLATLEDVLRVIDAHRAAPAGP